MKDKQKLPKGEVGEEHTGDDPMDDAEFKRLLEATLQEYKNLLDRLADA